MRVIQAIFVRVTDDARGEGKYEQNRIDNQKIADFYGMKGSFELLMPHHQLDSIGIQDLKQRFIFLIRQSGLRLTLLYAWIPGAIMRRTLIM